MKVYTFSASETTSVELLYPLRPANRRLEFKQFIAESFWEEVTRIQDCDVAIFPDKAFDTLSLAFNTSVLEATELAKAHGKPLIIDATCDSDQPLTLPGASILRFGLYRSLKQTYEFERPYWTNQKTKDELERLPISATSNQPSVGFCGTTNAVGKLFKVGRSVPLSLSKAILSKGALARRVDVRVQKGMSHRLRSAAMRSLARDTRITSHFDITNKLQDYYDPANPNRSSLETRFVDNIAQSDYVLCVRANGNYSGRFYMALNAGRIPLVVDTDTTFPFEDKIHMLKVPATALHRIADFVLEHYESVTPKELVQMKQENREAYNQLLAPHRYIPWLLQTVISKAGSS